MVALQFRSIIKYLVTSRIFFQNSVNTASSLRTESETVNYRTSVSHSHDHMSVNTSNLYHLSHLPLSISLDLFLFGVLPAYFHPTFDSIKYVDEYWGKEE